MDLGLAIGVIFVIIMLLLFNYAMNRIENDDF